MGKREKIGIFVIIVLLAILAISLWWSQDSKPPEISCSDSCMQIGVSNWRFLGGTPDQSFSTKESCVSFCNAWLRR